jgi:hypothetical protein
VNALTGIAHLDIPLDAYLSQIGQVFCLFDAQDVNLRP